MLTIRSFNSIWLRVWVPAATIRKVRDITTETWSGERKIWITRKYEDEMNEVMVE
jgi:hypothetical protein